MTATISSILHTAVRAILLRNKQKALQPFHQNLPQDPFIHVPLSPRAHHSFLRTLPPVSLAPWHVDHAGKSLSQDFWTFYPLCLEQFSPRYALGSLPHFFLLYLYVTSSARPFSVSYINFTLPSPQQNTPTLSFPVLSFFSTYLSLFSIYMYIHGYMI